MRTLLRDAAPPDFLETAAGARPPSARRAPPGHGRSCPGAVRGLPARRRLPALLLRGETTSNVGARAGVVEPPVSAAGAPGRPGARSGSLLRFARPPRARPDRLAAGGAWLASVCSGAFALARAGLLDGRRCTTNWKVTDRLRAEYPRAVVIDNRRC